MLGIEHVGRADRTAGEADVGRLGIAARAGRMARESFILNLDKWGKAGEDASKSAAATSREKLMQ